MSLLEDLNIEYTQWRPADDPTQPRGIEGTVKDRQIWQSSFGVFDMIYVVEDAMMDEDGGGEIPGDAWSWAALGAIATREVGRRDPRPGDRIGIAYKGEIENKVGDKPMHVFRVLTHQGPAHAPGSSYRPPLPMAAPDSQGSLGTGDEPF